MKLTVKHYYCFGKNADSVGKNLLSQMSWDAIRTDEDNQTPFSIPKEREVWVEKCRQHTAMVARGKAIADFLKNQKGAYKKVYSFGVGPGFMEYTLKTEYPELFLQCSDFAPKGVTRLKEVFKEADEIITFNMQSDSWINAGSDTLYILHRVDTDITNAEWKNIFEKMHGAGIEHILFVPSAIYAPKDLLWILLSGGYQKFKGSKMSFAGYLRTKDQLKSLFAEHYRLAQEIPIADLTGFLLKKI